MVGSWPCHAEVVLKLTLLTLKVKGVIFRILPLSLNKDTSNVLQKLKFYTAQHIVATEI